MEWLQTLFIVQLFLTLPPQPLQTTGFPQRLFSLVGDTHNSMRYIVGISSVKEKSLAISLPPYVLRKGYLLIEKVLDPTQYFQDSL